MGTKNHPGRFDCYEKAEPDEPMFVLLARDEDAPDIVEEWVLRKAEKARIGEYDVEKLYEAEDCAQAMRSWKRLRDAETGNLIKLDYESS